MFFTLYRPRYIQCVLLLLLFANTTWAEAILWLDTRSATEYEQGHLTHSLNIPHTEISSKIPPLNLAKNHKIIVYCRSGVRASYAKKALEKLGFTNVVNIGGIQHAQNLRKEE